MAKFFFENSTQSVVVEGFESYKTAVRSVAAQSSVVSSLLFLIYISDIDCNIQHWKTSHFADDTTLLGLIKVRT